MNNTQLVITMLVFLVCLAVGTFCIARPTAIQQYVLHLYEHSERAQRINPFWRWMQGTTYVMSIRLVGGLAVLMALLVLYSLIFQFKK
jgi:hypothetical protein